MSQSARRVLQSKDLKRFADIRRERLQVSGSDLFYTDSQEGRVWSENSSFNLLPSVGIDFLLVPAVNQPIALSGSFSAVTGEVTVSLYEGATFATFVPIPVENVNRSIGGSPSFAFGQTSGVVTTSAEVLTQYTTSVEPGPIGLMEPGNVDKEWLLKPAEIYVFRMLNQTDALNNVNYSLKFRELTMKDVRPE